MLLLTANWSGDKPMVGSTLRAGQEFGSLPDTAAMEVQIDLPQIEAQGIKAGNAVELHPLGRPDGAFASELSWVASAATVLDRENPVKYLSMRAAVPPEAVEKYRFVPGQRFAAKVILLRLPDALSVANVAIEEQDGKHWIQVRNGRGFERREVALGVRGTARSQVVSGLKAGDEVLLSAGGVELPLKTDDAVATPARPPATTRRPPRSHAMKWISKLPPVWREAVRELWRRACAPCSRCSADLRRRRHRRHAGGRRRQPARSAKLVESLGLRNLIAEVKPQDEATLKRSRRAQPRLSVADAHAALAVVPGAEKFAAEKHPHAHRVQRHRAQRRAGPASAPTGSNCPRCRSPRVAPWAQRRKERAGAGRGGRPQATLANLFPASIRRPTGEGQPRLAGGGGRARRPRPGQDDFEGVQLGSESNRIYVPLASARTVPFQPQEDEVDRFLLRLDSPTKLAAGAGVLSAVLDQRHAGIADYQLVGAAATVPAAPADAAHLPGGDGRDRVISRWWAASAS